MTLADAARRYLEVYDNEHGPHRGYKLNAAASALRSTYYVERDEHLWGQHARLAQVAREIMDATEEAKGE